jgi:hypothetical protein
MLSMAFFRTIPEFMTLMVSQKVVTPVKTGVQRTYHYSKKLESGFRRNDGKTYF